MPESNEYEIKIDYVPGRDDLANSLVALGKIVEGHKEVANALLSASGETESVSTSVEMQSIERGSIKLIFKKIFKQKNGDVVKDEALNQFINDATGTLTKFVNDNNEVKKENIDKIREQLVKDYNGAGGFNPLSIGAMKDDQIVQCLKSLEVPKGLLGAEQGVKATFLGQTYDMNKAFTVDETKIEKEYIETEVVKNQEVSIQVKKPDYVGTSKWTVVYNEKSVDAKIMDEKWLGKFQNSELPPSEFPSPKDTMVVKADITIERKDGKEQNVEMEIKEVLRVHKYIQADMKLF